MAAHKNNDDATGSGQPLLSSKPVDYPNLNEPMEQNDKKSLLPLESALMSQEEIRFRQVLLLLVGYLGVGALCFFLIRHQIKGEKTNGVLDSIYFCIVTMTTVGYGDLVPHSTLAKLLACVYVFSGMALVGLILGKAADYLVEKQQLLLVKAMYNYENASAGSVSAAEVLKDVETHKVKYKLVTATFILLVLIIAGIVFLSVVEDLKFVDALYCVCSTITTLGYGDMSFSTRGGRFFAVFWILSGTICLAQFFLYLTELYTQSRQNSFVKWVLTRQLTFSDLEAADLDHDKLVSVAEFVIYKLKEMGKINEEDISVLMERFRTLDADQSGNLTAADIMLLQQSS
ncbi:hypothetical protein WN944_009765 [Citrus x changshan-huyou]|uniref:EF-hand domain-containing protein n=1 Tax=Citrus x changshan-huyou TaxID=2935761 RepID=A0AAP0R023_9ROSI